MAEDYLQWGDYCFGRKSVSKKKAKGRRREPLISAPPEPDVILCAAGEAHVRGEHGAPKREGGPCHACKRKEPNHVE